MALAKDFIPQKPFDEFKWKWASWQCTEGINDPVILLGILFRMRKLEPLGVRYSSPEFAAELVELANDIKGINETITAVSLETRTGERNIIRNSGQYWRALGLIESNNSSGRIRLTEYGRDVADRKISQSEFAAITIQTYKLPNPQIYNKNEYSKWVASGIQLYPLMLILEILHSLYCISSDQMYITRDELLRIIVPLSGCQKAETTDYVNFILWYRAGEVDLEGWPNCCTRDNDRRVAREFLLFLSYYGYVELVAAEGRQSEKFIYNQQLDDEVTEIITMRQQPTYQQTLYSIRNIEVVSDIERKRVQASRYRPNQAKFRKEVLSAYERCIITNVGMPEVLEAAHIKPYKYKGEDTIANGLCMRMDMHLLYDTGHLRIATDGQIDLSQRARVEYGATVPPRITLPPFINIDFIRWRWDNYNGM